MSYTLPLQTAADATWLLAPAYTKPLQSAADASWESPGSTATGFLATKAGTPSTPLSAVGLSATKFGTPSLGFTASGMCVTQYGTPRGYEFWQQRSLPPTTKISGAFSPVDAVSAASGFACAVVGHPTCIVINVQAVHYLTSAAGFVATKFGMASTPVSAVGTAEGFLATFYGVALTTLPMFGAVTSYGVPVSRTSHAATGWSSTEFGGAAARQVGTAKGVRVTGMGAVTGRAGYLAGALVPVRFGKHRSSQTGVSAAYSLGCITRVPRPRGWSAFNYQASGALWTGVGTPTCTQVHRALHTPVTTRVGTPMLKRSDLC